MAGDSKIQRYLKNVDVQFISLVDSAANRREFIYKSTGANPDFTTQFTIKKTDEEKQLVYGIVYAPDEADAHGDAMTTDELQKAAHHFLEKARTNNVDTDHDFVADDGMIVESYILGKDDSKFPGEKEGSWAVVLKVTNEDTWDAVKKGDLKGISLAGKAQADKVEETTKSSFEKWFFQTAKKFLPDMDVPEDLGKPVQKDFNERIARKKVMESVYALQDEFHSIYWDDEITDKKAAISEAVSQFSEYISGLELPESTTKNSDTMSTEKNKGGKPEEEKETPGTVEKGSGEQPSGKDGDSTLSEQFESFAKEMKKTVSDLSDKVDSLEKAAPGRQSQEDAEDIEKNDDYNPKAPLNLLG